MSHHGYLVISDITGYTAYLSEAELEHANDILRELMEAVLDATRPPLVISRLEGDAVFAYAPAESFLHGMTLVETLENTYSAFRRTLKTIRLNTTCQCKACVNSPNLDLKSFVHAGTYSVQKIGSYTDLLGNDVNLLFRLTKNSIPEATGLDAYAAYSEAAVKMLGIESLAATMKTHREAYDHVGEVNLYVQDLHAVWERRQHEQRVIVQPEDALVVAELDFPVEPGVAWEYLTDPEYRKTLLGSDKQEVHDLVDGRVDSGATYLCYHGDVTLQQTIVDWHPFRYYTFHTQDLMMPVTSHVTLALLPVEGGTRVSWRVSYPEGKQKDRRNWIKMYQDMGEEMMVGLLEGVRDRIPDHHKTDPVRQSEETVNISPDEIQAAISDRLSGKPQEPPPA